MEPTVNDKCKTKTRERRAKRALSNLSVKTFLARNPKWMSQMAAKRFEKRGIVKPQHSVSVEKKAQRAKRITVRFSSKLL